MPIPFIIGAVAAGIAVAKGALDHVDASNTNDLAQWKIEEAQENFEAEKTKLEKTQKKLEKSLVKLGTSKQDVLETSFPLFLKTYEKIKNIRFEDSDAIHEISKFVIDDQNVGEVKEISSTFLPSVAAGVTEAAAAGALISFATGGSALFLAGSAAGMVSMGATAAGTLLTLGAPGLALSALGSGIASAAGLMATPLAALVAPAVLFSGLSAKGNADKNYDKAKEYEAEVNKAVEEMKTSATVCRAISRRSDMFNKLLKDLNEMFYDCSERLDLVLKEKETTQKKKRFSVNDFSSEEIALIAVTRSLAGAIKSILDTPILSNEGELTTESKDTGNKLKKCLPDFKEQYDFLVAEQ